MLCVDRAHSRHDRGWTLEDPGEPKGSGCVIAVIDRHQTQSIVHQLQNRAGEPSSFDKSARESAPEQARHQTKTQDNDGFAGQLGGPMFACRNGRRRLYPDAFVYGDSRAAFKVNENTS
jgi:hypothetical protein